MEPKGLRRCVRCVLPETVPFVEFDADGVCRHCRNPAVSNEVADVSRLVEQCSRLGRNPYGNDCIVALSGGRDSSYVLHYAVENLGLKPLVYIYDWGMLTATGRENQINLCKRLKLNEVFFSDSPELKRKNIGLNLTAWLKASEPQAGMIPLFMAGDKPFFYHARKLKVEAQLQMMLFGITDVEAEDFKEGFCGVRTESFRADKKHYGLLPVQKLKVVSYYARQFVSNPRYINSSIGETLFGFYSYYLLPHDYFTNLFQFVRWDEEHIVTTLQSQYGWRAEPDSASTWRTGDATAPLIHYLFLSLYGFTENDFLRSNQIRRGMLTREEALRRLAVENKPRPEGLRHFCTLIGMDYGFLVDRVGSFAEALQRAKKAGPDLPGG